MAEQDPYVLIAEAKRPMGRLFAYLLPYRRSFVLSLLSSVLNKVLDLMPPIMVAWTIDTLNGQPPAWIGGIVGSRESWPTAIFLAGLVVVVFALESLFQWGYQYGFMRLAQQVQDDLRVDAYNQIQSREIEFFEEHRLGETMAMLNDDVNQLERFLNSGFNELVQLAVLFIFAGAVLFSTSWQLALVGMAPIPIIISGSLLYQRRIQPRYVRIRRAVGQLASRLENNIAGILTIKSFTAETFETARVREASREYRVANFDAIGLSAIYVPLIRMAIAVGFGGVLLIGSYWVLSGLPYITLGELVLFSMMIQRMLWPLTRLGSTLDEYERAKASARRTFGLLSTNPTIVDPDAPSPLGRARGEVMFDHVLFKYRRGVPVLQGASFQVREGETLGVAGPTGAGKTTLIKLLLRLYDVTGGAVRVDGVDVRGLSLDDLRGNIALVSQDVYLFHGTIRENIAYSKSHVSLDIVSDAAMQAEFHEFVASLPDGYETLVGERGIKLSGGQRQRLSLARAILKNAPILLLDEATSSVDTETERAIQRNLRRLTAGRTAIVIAHRLSTIRHADRIIVIKDGRIVEEGHHDDLLVWGGTYADLWNIQAGEAGAPDPTVKTST